MNSARKPQLHCDVDGALSSLYVENIHSGSARVVSIQLNFQVHQGNSVACRAHFGQINTRLNARWSAARRDINSKRIHSMRICLFAKSYKENVFKGKNDRRMCFYYMYAHQIPALGNPLKTTRSI